MCNEILWSQNCESGNAGEVAERVWSEWEDVRGRVSAVKSRGRGGFYMDVGDGDMKLIYSI
jgi:hypothetical protein